MIPATNRDLLYSTHLKGDEELYIKDDSLVVIHEDKGIILTLDLGMLRCVLPTSHDSIKIFWRAPKSEDGTLWKYFERYQQEFKLDLKKSFPDKKQKRMAEKTESKKITNIILHAIQNTHFVNTLNIKANIAMHAGEYVRGISEGQCNIGDGELVITNLGIYFVSFKKGLYLDLPLDLLDSYDFKNKTVRIHYFEPMWIDGYDSQSKKNRKFEIRIKDDDPSLVCNTITTAYADGGAKEIRELQTLTEEFGSLTADELHAAYYTGKFGESKPIDRYFTILAKKKWGIPNTPAVALQDAHVVAACLTTGIPLDIAGDLTADDKKLRECTLDYVKNYNQYMTKYDQLYLDLEKIITVNLNEKELELLKTCHPRVTDDTIQQLAKIGKIPDESFEPESLVKWRAFVESFSRDLQGQNLPDYPNGFTSEWKFEIVCPWSADDARRIVGDGDYISIITAIKSLDEKYESTLHVTPPIHPELFSKKFQSTQGLYAAIRVGRVYEQWCMTSPLTEFNDPTDRGWVQYAIDSLDEEKLERVRDYHGVEETPVEHLNRCEMVSQNHKTRLERTIKPKDIPEKDIYADAWFDVNKHRWFTTSQYSRITELGLEIMSQNECEQKYGFRALVFSEDAVQLKHGMPAIYDENNRWWILLCTVYDDKITKEMVHDKWHLKSLRYDTVESSAGIADSGEVNAATTQEQKFNAELQTSQDDLLPFDERLRRLFFASIVACPVMVLHKEKL